MSVVRFEIPLEIVLEAPFCIPGSDVGSIGLDVTLARNAAGKVIIPGSHLKGVLRDACMQIVDAAPKAVIGEFALKEAVTHFFGPEPRREREFIEDRGCLIFGALEAQDSETSVGTPVVRVQIDNETGAAKDGHLAFIESPWSIGQEVTFRGAVILQSGEVRKAASARGLLERALARVAAFGGAKSAGFGQLIRHAVSEPVSIFAASVAPETRRMRVRYTIDRPFIVDASYEGSNLSKGSDILPGAAIKAVIAKSLEAAGWVDGHAQDALARTRIGHAFPQGRERIPPLSLYICGEGKLGCVLRGRKPPAGAKFAPDWKDEDRDSIKKLFFPKARDLKRIGVTRTAVDGDVASYDPEEG